MKKTMILLAMIIATVSGFSQTNDVEITADEIQQAMMPRPTFGDYFEGYTEDNIRPNDSSLRTGSNFR